MSDDRDNFEDGIQPADFTRRRVAAILRREKPNPVQGDYAQWKGLLVRGQIHEAAKDAFGFIQIGKLEVITYNLFGKIKTWRVIPMDKRRFPKSAIKKPANCNFHSRFYAPPPPDRP